MTGDIHQTAAKGFERGASDYEKGRPSYPVEALATLAAATGIGAGSTVVDVGAGTGKFTRLLETTGARIIAVEPVDAMRRALLQGGPDLEVHDGTAESMPLPSASANVITVAQAFHWFDQRRALDEFARVLGPDGWLALIWNTRDTTVPWAARIDKLMDRFAGDAPRFRGDQGQWRDVLDAHGAFGPVRSATFDNPVPGVDADTMRARVASTSYVSALPDDEREDVLREVAEILRDGPIADEGPTFVDRYRTELYWCQRV